jgi:DNA invertase Pin-like site-specific DNA recombinase
MDALTKYSYGEIFHDKMSGTKKQRPGLAEALEDVREGDTIVVWRLDRLGRNMQDLIQIVNTLNERGVGFHSLQENLTMDKSNATGQLMFHLFAAFAEFERSAAGRASARARGRLDGRPKKFGPKDIEMMKALIESGTPIKDVAEKWSVSRTTIYRYLEK